MLNVKQNSPNGLGIGSLFGGLTREIIPVSKSSIKNLNKVMDEKSMKVMGKTLQKDAQDTAINETLNLLNKRNIKKSKKQHLKKAAKNILSKTNRKKSPSLSQSKTKQNNKISTSRKRKLKQNKGPRSKKPLIDDDY